MTASSRGIRARYVLLVCALLLSSAVSLLLGQDANWDLRNYHFYDPYALVRDRVDWDIAPAQLQSYYNPLADLPFYWAVRADLRPQWIAVLLAVPPAIAGFFLFLSLERLFAESTTPRRQVSVALALLIGLTGTAGLPLVGTTTNDWLGAMPIMAALWLALISDGAQRARQLRLIALAGLLCGLAAGVKLTTAFYAASLFLALLVTVRPFRFQAVACTATFASFAAIGFIAIAGFWLWRMYDRFGNPFFPYFNDWFRSLWWEFTALPSGYEPHTPLQWLELPFRLFRYNAGVVGELAFRDWRVPLGFFAAVVLVAVFAPQLSWRRQLLAVFWLLSYVLWTFEHAVYRYIIPLELLSGAIVLMLVLRLLPLRAHFAAALVATGVVLAKTAYPAVPRVQFGHHFFEVNAPTLPDNALVLLVEDAPLAYVIPFLDPSARFVGANNNLVHPGQRNLLAQKVTRVIGEHRGPLFSLQSPTGLGDDALSAYGLAKRADGCRAIETNMPAQPLKLCELIRVANQK